MPARMMPARMILGGAALLAALAAAIAFPGPARGEPSTPPRQVVVAASADDWIGVTDASGHMILGRLLHQGDTLALPNGSGLVFTAGNAGATTLLVDGRKAPPIGSAGEVVHDQPLDPALIAAGRLPAQIAAARSAAQIAEARSTATAPVAATAPATATAKNIGDNSARQPDAASGAPEQKIAATPPQEPEPAPTPDARARKAGRITVAASADDWISVTDASG
ncbi:MAG: DUF4115 domain-containing protein, partial [Acetobacteraceae bacterium]